jgi:four helix bundle protein
MKNFKKLRIWEKGMAIASKSFLLVNSFPGDQKFGLGRQITRAGVSIPSNIAEGSSRRTEKDYCYFVTISLGSAYELETQLLIAKSIKMGDDQLREELLVEICEEQSMLLAFLQKLSPNRKA